MSAGVVGPQEIAEARTWDTHVLSMPEPHILQSWAWGETKQQTGWRAKRLIWSEQAPIPKMSDRFATWAVASALFRRLNPRIPLAVGYAPKGPLLDWSDEELRVRVLRDLEQEARKARALFIKIDPDVDADSPDGRALVDLLGKRGWVYSGEQIQYRNTVVSDLSPDEDSLLAAMKPKWRYNIRLAERRGVQVCDGRPQDLPAFYAMYLETGQRDGFLVRPFSYYQAIWERFLSEGLAHLLLAEVDGTPVAGLILFCYGPTAWYFYGASTSEAREFMPNHALQWAALRWAKQRGCARYDWWGAPDELSESDPMWGVYRFKQGFGGEFASHIGAWDFPVNKQLYWAYTRAMPKVIDVMRRRHKG
jgi:lipid II:glycine glycyltransferase (peptidoglycan interpeptide bridge formation enzyme)